MEKLTVSITEAAEALGVSARYLYDRARTGQLPGALRLGGRWLIRVDILDKWLRSQAQQAKAEPLVEVG